MQEISTWAHYLIFGMMVVPSKVHLFTQMFKEEQMTNFYYDDPIDQDNYEDHQETFYTHEATYAPPMTPQKNVWANRGLSRFVGTTLWCVMLIGFVVGTIWWFDILPSDTDKKTVTVAKLSNTQMQITPSRTKENNVDSLENPFENSSVKNSDSIYKIDTQQNKAHRKRKLPAPNDLLAHRNKTEHQWKPEKGQVRHSVHQPPLPSMTKTASPSKVALASYEKTVEAITPPKRLLPPNNNKPNLNLAAIDELLQAGKELEAHQLLSKIYWEHPDARQQISSRLTSTANAIFISRQKHYTAPYVVEQGDQLIQIAQQYYVPWQYLARLNRTNPQSIRPGQKLKVIKGPFAAVIDLSDFELTIHASGYFVKRYKIGIGKKDSTPLGTFKVLNKLENPTYYGPSGVVIDAESINNPLGERWIDLGDSYGIHGTIDPKSIGKAESRGCIRMQNEDVAEVFDFLGRGSIVKIQK